jgi:hypothetical protein
MTSQEEIRHSATLNLQHKWMYAFQLSFTLYRKAAYRDGDSFFPLQRKKYGTLVTASHILTKQKNEK